MSNTLPIENNVLLTYETKIIRPGRFFHWKVKVVREWPRHVQIPGIKLFSQPIDWYLLSNLRTNLNGFNNAQTPSVNDNDQTGYWSKPHWKIKRKRSDSVLWQKPLQRPKNPKNNVTTQKRHQKLRIHNECGPT